MSDSKWMNTQHPDQQNSSDAISVTPFSSEDEKRKLIQLQLLLLLHTHKCKKSENQSVEGAVQCSSPHCPVMKNVLRHMKTCMVGKSCPVPHCASSTTILSHFKNCTSSCCNVCIPVKQALKSTGVQTSHVPSPSDMQQRCPPLGHQQNAGNICADNNLAIQPSQAVLNPHGAIPGKYRRSKAWHRLMTKDMRDRVVVKIVQAIFPMVNMSKTQDERMIAIFEYARKIEDVMHEAADNREEYCELIGDKLFRIHKEMEVKREKSKNLEEKQQVMPGSGLDSSNDSSVVQSKVLPSWNPLPPRLENSPGYVSSSSFMTGPNGGKKDFELFSSSGSQLSNSINANNQNESYQAQSSLPPFVSLQQHLSHDHLDNMNPPMATASASEDSLALPAYSAAIGSKLLSSSESHSSTSVIADNQNESNLAQVRMSLPPVSTQHQELSHAHLDYMHPSVATASVDSSVLPTYSATIGSNLFSSSGSQLSNSINTNNQNESYQAQTRSCPPPPVSLQQQQLSQAHLHNMNTSVTNTASSSVDSSATPSTLSGTQVSQPSSQMSDNSETRGIAFELLKDKEDSSEVEGSALSEDEVTLTIL